MTRVLVLFFFLSAVVQSAVPGQDAYQIMAIRSPRDQALFAQGLREAEKFRQELLKGARNQLSRAEMLIDLTISFHQASTKPLTEHVSLERFRLQRSELFSGVTGVTNWIDGKDAFRPFEGKWYGMWDQARVDREGSIVIRFLPPSPLRGGSAFFLRDVHFASAQDGFGWKVVALPVANLYSSFIMGSFYKAEGGNRNRAGIGRPGIGIRPGPSQVIWIMPEEIRFEEVFGGASRAEERYVVTGFNYEMREGRPVIRGEAFQAVHTREPRNRPPWFKFAVELEGP